MFKLIIFLCDMIMGYFDGINFVNMGDFPNHHNHHESIFGNYYGIQYNHAETLYCAVGDSVPQYRHGAYAFITFPGGHFRYGHGEEGTRHHMFVCFNGPRVDGYVASGLLTPKSKNPLIKINHFDLFYRQMRELQDCLRHNPSHYDRAVNLLESLLLLLHEEEEETLSADSSLKNAFAELAGLIGDSPELDWNFRHESETLHLSYPHFRRLFGRFLGCPPGQYLLRCRLNAAAAMLCHSELTVAEIAERNLFCDVHHFSKLFRKNYLLPPAQFRTEFKSHH